MKNKKKIVFGVVLALLLSFMAPAGAQDLGGVRKVQAATVVGTPKLVSATASGTSKVTVKWQKAWRAEGYRVYRKTPGGYWKGLRTVAGGTKVSYVDPTAAPGTQYYYTVRAYKTVKGSKVLGGYNKTGVGALTGLDTPSLVWAKHNGAPNLVKLQWKPVRGAKGYVVYKKDSSRWQRLAVVKSGKTAVYYDKKAKETDANLYTVRAYTNYGKTYKYSGYVKAGVKSDVFRYAYMDVVIKRISATEVLVSDGISLVPKDFGKNFSKYKVGDKIRIKYYGSITETYPGTIDHVVSITKIS